jgi:hypothetical protein
MPAQFWEIFAGLVALVLAIPFHILSGRGSARTRMELTELERLLQATPRLNTDLVEAANKRTPPASIEKGEEQGQIKTWLHPKYRRFKWR